MQDLDVLPAWATRQRNRLLIRRNDQKIVRWINHRPLAKTSSEATDEKTDAAEAATYDPVVHFAASRNNRKQ